MNIYKKLSIKLSRFSITDISCVASVYFLLGILICSWYLPFLAISALAYLLLAFVSAMPLVLEFVGLDGVNAKEKIQNYLHKNNPTKQILLFLSCFFLALFVCALVPLLIGVKWYVYIAMIVVLAIKPAKKTLFW